MFLQLNDPKPLQILMLEAAVRRCLTKYVFLKFSQNSQENNCAKISLPNKVADLLGSEKDPGKP